MADEKLDPEEKIQQMEAELARLSRLVYYDELTGLLNRRGFLEEAERVFLLISSSNTPVERRTGFRIPFAVVFLDIDNFKKINDTHGHAAGDEALKILAQVLHKTLRSGDLFGRFGGEEFVVALISVDKPRAGLIAEKIRLALERAEFDWQGERVPLTASFGVVEYTTESKLIDLVAKADQAMYQAKEQGKNRTVVA